MHTCTEGECSYIHILGSYLCMRCQQLAGRGKRLLDVPVCFISHTSTHMLVNMYAYRAGEGRSPCWLAYALSCGHTIPTHTHKCAHNDILNAYMYSRTRQVKGELAAAKDAADTSTKLAQMYEDKCKELREKYAMLRYFASLCAKMHVRVP
jgi:hypothetical protein